MVEGEGFEPSKAVPTDLQSAPFGQLGNPSTRVPKEPTIAIIQYGSTYVKMVLIGFSTGSQPYSALVSFFEIPFQLAFYTLQSIINGLDMPMQLLGNFLVRAAI